ncbi:MAG: hypothetical protein ACRELV_10945 [Longimicrobiales bacterium]
MSLIWFHRVLIGTAIVFFLVFGGVRVAAFLETGATSDLLLGLVSCAAGIALAFYLQRLRRFLGLPD